MSNDNQALLKLTDENFIEVAVNSELPAIVDFWAEWCGPCQIMNPIIEEIADDYKGRAIVGKVNVDENAKTSTDYGIRSIPTIVLLKNGQVVDRLVGTMSKQKLEQRIEALFSDANTESAEPAEE